MKIKRILLLIVIVFISVFLTGCKENNENYLSGTELAKKMLSNERLDSNGLKAGDNIFTKGSKDFRELSRKTLESVRSSNTDIFNEASVIKTGNKITWTNIGPSTNAISYFNNLTEVISSNAIAVANIIDETKTNVRVVDKWIKIGNTKILLIVDENSETIYFNDGSQTRICTRSKNNYGQNVYDVFISNSETGYNIRMKYIPNTRYEMYEETSFGDNLLFIADRTKGYWEAVVISEYSTHYNFQTIIMKNDLTYTYNYSVDNNLLDSVTIINGDRTADIINFNGSSANLYLGSLKGIKSFEIETNSIVSATSGKEGDVYEFEDGSYATTGRKSATINLTNGNKIEDALDSMLGADNSLIDTYNSTSKNIVDLLVDTGILSSKREAREFITNGSISLNGEKVNDLEMVVNKETSLYNKYVIIRRGKKKYYLVIMED